MNQQNVERDNLTATGHASKSETTNSTIEHYNEIFDNFHFQMTAFDDFKQKKAQLRA